MHATLASAASIKYFDLFIMASHGGTSSINSLWTLVRSRNAVTQLFCLDEMYAITALVSYNKHHDDPADEICSPFKPPARTCFWLLHVL